MNEKDQRSITQKYEALDSKEAAEKIIKEYAFIFYLFSSCVC